jgi:hypothetical protein
MTMSTRLRIRPVAGLKKLWLAVLSRRWATFLLLGIAFLAFGAGTFSLIVLLRINTALIAEHGWTAVRDGGLLQLVELLLTGYASLAAYVVFKVCEYTLVRQFSGTR